MDLVDGAAFENARPSFFGVEQGGQRFPVGFKEVSLGVPKSWGSWALDLIQWGDPSPKSSMGMLWRPTLLSLTSVTLAFILHRHKNDHLFEGQFHIDSQFRILQI